MSRTNSGSTEFSFESRPSGPDFFLRSGHAKSREGRDARARSLIASAEGILDWALFERQWCKEAAIPSRNGMARFIE